MQQVSIGFSRLKCIFSDFSSDLACVRVCVCVRGEGDWGGGNRWMCVGVCGGSECMWVLVGGGGEGGSGGDVHGYICGWVVGEGGVERDCWRQVRVQCM